MPIQTTKNIWHNGQLIPWEKANIHVMSHVVHYGSSIFEGIRCYTQPEGAAIFRLHEHMQRFLQSGKIYRMDLPYTVEQLETAVIDVVESNGATPCYIRPVAFRGYGEIGVNGLKCPIEVYVANFPWGNFLHGNEGANVCVSSWNRLAPNTMPSLAKAGANYMNSQLIRMEASVNGYDEGIALDVNGYLSEGSGENLFIIRGGTLYTSPLANSVLNGITRDSIVTLARQMSIPRRRAGPPPRAPLHLRRGFLHRHRSGGNASTFRRPHRHRRRHHGSHHHRSPQGLLRHRQWTCRGPLQLADSRNCPRARCGLTGKPSARRAAAFGLPLVVVTIRFYPV